MKHEIISEFISKATLRGFCHCGLSAILIQERFPTSLPAGRQAGMT